MPCPKCGKDDCPNWILSKTLPVALMQALSVNDPEAENLSDEELVESQDIEDTLLQDQQVQPQNDPYMALPNEPSDAAKNEYASNGLNMLQMRKKMLGEPIHVQIDDRRTEECAHVGPHSISPVFQSYFGGVPKVEHLDDAEFYRLKRQVLYKKDPKKPPYASYNQQLAQPLGGQQEEEENGFNINYNASLEDLLARRNVLINIPSSSRAAHPELDVIDTILRYRGVDSNGDSINAPRNDSDTFNDGESFQNGQPSAHIPPLRRSSRFHERGDQNLVNDFLGEATVAKIGAAQPRRQRGRPRSTASVRVSSRASKSILKRSSSGVEFSDEEDEESRPSEAASKKSKAKKSVTKPTAKKPTKAKIKSIGALFDNAENELFSDQERLYDSEHEDEDAEEPPLFFVARCTACVFAANERDVTDGKVAVNAAVVVPVYGVSRVIYNKIDDEDTAVEKAKEYAEGAGYKYGKSDGKFIVFLSKPAKPCEHDEQICALEEENVALRARVDKHEEEMSKMKLMFEQQQRRLDRIVNGQVNVHSLLRDDRRTAETDGTSALSANQNSASAETSQSLLTSRPSNSQASLATALKNISDVPTFQFVDEDTVDTLKKRFPDQKLFIRAIYKHMFTDYDTFNQQLPADKSAENAKICILMLNAVNDAKRKEILELIHAEWQHQRKLLRKKITELEATSVAMIDKPFALHQGTDSNFYPDEDVPFDRIRGERVSAWPILFKGGSMGDTMYAHRPEGSNRWSYFIITTQGIFIPCSK